MTNRLPAASPPPAGLLQHILHSTLYILELAIEDSRAMMRRTFGDEKTARIIPAFVYLQEVHYQHFLEAWRSSSDHHGAPHIGDTTILPVSASKMPDKHILALSPLSTGEFLPDHTAVCTTHWIEQKPSS